MSIFDWLRDRWKSQSKRYTYLHFEPGNVVGGPSQNIERIAPGEHYYRLWLVGMSLENDRKWFGEWQPTVYSVLRFRFGDKDEIITHLAGPTLLDEQRFGQTTRRVLLNYGLTTLLPFNGGDVEIESGLLAVPGKNDAKALIQTLSDFSKLLVVPELSTALNVTQALADGLGGLVGATSAQPELRFHQTFTGSAGAGANRLRPGYFAVIGVEEGVYPRSQLWVKEDVLCVGPSLENAKPLTGCHYLLFRIEATAERDDWESLKAIQAPYEESLEFLTGSSYERDAEKRKGMLEEAERRLGMAKLATFRARELTRLVGRNQVLDAIQKGYEYAKSKLGVGATGISENLQTFGSAMRNRIGVGEARSRGVTDEQQVFPRPRTLWLSTAISRDVQIVTSLRSPAGRFLRRGRVLVRRTPHFQLSETHPLQPGASVKVRVYADDEAPLAGEIADIIAVLVPEKTKVLKTVVSISGTAHFEFSDKREQPFSISVENPKAVTSATFNVTVRQQWPADAGPPRLWAYFNHKGRPCGQVSIGVQIQGVEAASDQEPPPPGAIRVDEAKAADLTIEVRDPHRNQKDLEIWVRSRHLKAPVGPVQWELPQQTYEFVTGIMNDFVEPELSDRARVDNLIGAGITFFKAIPPEVQQAIWTVIDSGKLKTILVQSAEPHIPWELMIPTRDGDANQPAGEALGVAYTVGRWVSGDSIAPPQRIPLKNSLVVAPDYPGPEPEKLDHAEGEAKYVETLFPGTSVVPTSYDDVMHALENESFDLCHFVCHGAKAAGGRQTIYLVPDKLSTLQLKTLRGKTKSIADRAFVFLNACEVGQLAPSLVGADGFAPSFIGLGAGAVVAPLWSVKDSIASEIARSFYEKVCASPEVPFAEVLGEIRREAYQKGEDSYAAYCFYGDPAAIPELQITRVLP